MLSLRNSLRAIFLFINRAYLPFSLGRKSHSPYVTRIETLDVMLRDCRCQNGMMVIPDFDGGGNRIDSIGSQGDPGLASIIGYVLTQELS
jgi:hypothetical protein